MTSRVGYQVYGRAADEAVLLLLEEEVQDAGRPPLALTLPERSSVQPVYEHLLCSPNDMRPVAAWAQQLGTAERSLRRAFVKMPVYRSPHGASGLVRCTRCSG